MKKLKKYWHIVAALICLIAFFLTDGVVSDVFKYSYRGFIAFGLIKTGWMGLFDNSVLQASVAGGLLLMALALIILSILDIMGYRGGFIPEWVWLGARGIIDPIYYVYVPYVERKRSKAVSKCDTCDNREACLALRENADNNEHKSCH